MRRARIILAAACAFGAGHTVASAATPKFEARDCEPQAAAAGARCGVVYVPENHARPRARRIGLNVIVLPATGKPQTRSAQYDLDGGPGFAATDFLAFYAGEGASYRTSRDIVLADMRGTGRSNPLRCFGIEELEKRQPLAALYPPQLVAECARQSTVADDPAQYTTAAAARDIERIRLALGYEQLDLVALSYGTTLALRYITDFPRRVRSAVLMGTVAAKFTPPRHHATAAETAWQQLVADCAADPPCRDSFGDLDRQLSAALGQAQSQPGASAAAFMEKLRTRLYSPASRASVPASLAAAASGDFTAFTRTAPGRVFADGLYLSISCAESFAWMDVDAAIAASRATHFGAYRLERQRDACEHWPRGAQDPQLMALRESSVPVLFIAGERDPVTPIGWAREVAAYFPGSRLASLPQGAHVFDGLSGLDTCLDATIVQFLDAADAAALDLSCLRDMAPPPFVIAP